MSIQKFGELPDGGGVSEIRLRNGAGMAASIITFGAALRDLAIPLPGGETRRVVLGMRSLEDYLDNPAYLGVTAGRHSSRIGGGRFLIDGAAHLLSLNDRGRHHLHGGAVGFSRRNWQVLAADPASVTLGLVSPDGDQGYPGTVDARCTYRLEEPATLSVVMTAVTDAPTAVNLAHHSYFTLTPGRPIRDHALEVNARHYTPFDADSIPTGEIRAVAGTPFDFREARPIGRIGDAAAPTYDACFVLDGDPGIVRRAAWLSAPDAGLAMEVHTSERCLVFYDGWGLQPTATDLDGRALQPHAGLCLEPMTFLDSTNHPWFPQAVLRPGEVYRQVTEYRFAAG